MTPPTLPPSLPLPQCFNQLDLPAYSSLEEMRDKLLVALQNSSEGFGFA